MTIFDVSRNPESIPFSDVLRALAAIAELHGMTMLIVGATARDIAIAADGSDMRLRATTDVDIAVAVENAAAFDALVRGLAPAVSPTGHSFIVEGTNVDIIPFGGIERMNRTIEWPGGSTMNTLGFSEALQSAIDLRLTADVVVKVASLPALCALKLFAWADRGHWTGRDAVDLRSLLEAYGDGTRLDRIYAERNYPLLEFYGLEVRRVGAHLMGVDLRRDLGENVAASAVRIVEGGVASGRLPAAMQGLDVATNELMLQALCAGCAAGT